VSVNTAYILSGINADSHPASLSGLLANATRNATYLDAANRSFQFMHDQFYSSITNSLADAIIGDTCELFNTGYLMDPAIFIEGTAILASVTGNGTLRDLSVSHFMGIS
jgi:hypothetical protein